MVNFQVTYDVVDGRGGSVAQKATIAVTGVNDVAAIGGETAGTVTEDGEATAYGFLSIVDVDVNTINGRSEARFQTQAPTALKYGTFSLVNANAGLWLYELDNNNAVVRALKTGQTLIEIAQVKAFDNTVASVVITINGTTDGNEPTNTVPSVGSPLTATATEDSGVVTVDLLTGAFDPDGDTLQVVNLAGLVAGVTQSGTTLLVDTGNAAFQSLAVGAQSKIVVTYEVSDGKGGTAAQSATMTVTGVNDPAVIGGTVLGSVIEDGVLTATGALTIADADTGHAGFQAGTLAGAYGSLVLAVGGAWTYSLNNANAAVQALDSGQSLTDTIAAKAIDGTTRNVDVTVNGADEPSVNPPAGHDDAYVLLEGRALAVSGSTGVQFNDEGTLPLAASTISGPVHGVLQLSANGGLTYTPNPGFQGIDSFTYRASNGGGFQDAEAIVHVVSVTVGATTTLDLLALSAEQQIAATYVAFLRPRRRRAGLRFLGQRVPGRAAGPGTGDAVRQHRQLLRDQRRGAGPLSVPRQSVRCERRANRGLPRHCLRQPVQPRLRCRGPQLLDRPDPADAGGRPVRRLGAGQHRRRRAGQRRRQGHHHPDGQGRRQPRLRLRAGRARHAMGRRHRHRRRHPASAPGDRRGRNRAARRPQRRDPGRGARLVPAANGTLLVGWTGHAVAFQG